MLAAGSWRRLLLRSKLSHDLHSAACCRSVLFGAAIFIIVLLHEFLSFLYEGTMLLVVVVLHSLRLLDGHIVFVVIAHHNALLLSFLDDVVF